MKRIAIFQSDLGVGGIQKSLVNLLKNISYLPKIPRVYSFLPFDIARGQIRFDFPERVVYDLAIDFNSYQCSCAVGATTVPANKRVMWIHNDVRVKLRNEWTYRVLWHFSRGNSSIMTLSSRFRPRWRDLSAPCPASGTSPLP